MNEPTTNWDDLRFFHAVAEAGSLSAAARTLGVNQSTMSRRIRGFEDRIGLRLFDKLPTGYALTTAGLELLARVEVIADSVDGIERHLVGRDDSLEGSLRVTVARGFVGPIAPAFARFTEAQPGIDLEVVADDAMRSLSRREADVAIRVTYGAPPPTLVGRRLLSVALAPYLRVDVDPEPPRWIGWDASMSQVPVARWMSAHVDPGAIRWRVNAMDAMLSGARAGVGAAFLPCWIGEREDALRRLSAPVPALAPHLWVLAHEDLRRSARVQFFSRWIADALLEDAPLIEGREE